MRNSNKNIYIIMIAVLLLGVTIGYAVINSTLNINGRSNIRKKYLECTF